MNPWKGTSLSISCFASGLREMMKPDAARMPATMSAIGRSKSMNPSWARSYAQ